MASPYCDRHIHFVTGRLAEHALREELSKLAPRMGFIPSVQVMPITVAALMTCQWVAGRLAVPPETELVILPGYCRGELSSVAAAADRPVEVGPMDLHQLSEYFGGGASAREHYGEYQIEIIAEINHCPLRSLESIYAEATQLKAEGAEVIDIGCDPVQPWPQVGECVAELVAAGMRVSVDSFHSSDCEAAVAAGAELILSANATNREALAELGTEVVIVPDEIGTLHGMDDTLQFFQRRGIPFRLDPILEPIGLGFMNSLVRYHETRRRWPNVEIMMGIGNLTELTDVDSAGVNLLLLAACEELGIRSVLTTQVINWARSSVRECDVARRLVNYSVRQRTPPKRVDDRLIMLRDDRLIEQGPEQLARLTAEIRDHNYRIFAERGELHVIRGGLHVHGTDPTLLLDELLAADGDRIDASHAFYLGYELSKARTALTLGKNYQQDEALRWGHLTVPERSRHDRLRKK